MAVTADTIKTRPNRATVRWVSLAFAGVIATASAVVLSQDDPRAASPGVGRSVPTHGAVPMSPDAAEHWLAPEPVAVPMSPDAAEHWLAPEPVAVPMSPDAAEHWLAPEPVAVPMSPDAAEHWLDNE